MWPFSRKCSVSNERLIANLASAVGELKTKVSKIDSTGYAFIEVLDQRLAVIEEKLGILTPTTLNEQSTFGETECCNTGCCSKEN
jgi:hypothetical protein